MKVYIYKMHAGIVGTDETFWETCLVDKWEYAIDHAMSYGNEQDEDGEWSEGAEPECWLEGITTSVEELKEYEGDLLRGSETFEDLVKEIGL